MGKNLPFPQLVIARFLPSTVAPENGWLEDGVSFWGISGLFSRAKNVSSGSVIDGLGPCGLDS